jgi:hypothetical protein
MAEGTGKVGGNAGRMPAGLYADRKCLLGSMQKDCPRGSKHFFYLERENKKQLRIRLHGMI